MAVPQLEPKSRYEFLLAEAYRRLETSIVNHTDTILELELTTEIDLQEEVN